MTQSTVKEKPQLTEDQIEEIAEKAAEKAIGKLTAHVYQEVGKSVIGKMTWMIGALSVALYLWAQSKGLLK